MILFIDTTGAEKITIALYSKKGEEIETSNLLVGSERSEKLIPLLGALLKKYKAKKITSIVVVKGPEGRFSTVRLGVVSANMLGFGWDVPVVGISQSQVSDLPKIIKQIKTKKFGQPIVPVYSAEPNIG